MLRIAVLVLSMLLLAPLAVAQEEEAPPANDVVVFANGDALTGRVVALADGELTFESTMFGEIVIPIASIQSLTTDGTVELLTLGGETLKRRITGIVDGKLQLAGPEGEGLSIPTLELSELDKINPPVKPPVAWTGNVTLGAYFFEGNTNRRGVNFSATAQRRTDFDRITGSAWWDYADTQNDVTKERVIDQRRVRGLAQYDYFLCEKAYILANVEALGDLQANIDLQFTTGAGFGYQWVEDDDIKFNTELGLTYFSQEFRTMEPSQEYVAVRAAYNLRWQMFEDLLLLHKLQAIPSVEDAENVTVNQSTALQYSFTEKMFTELRWELDYDNTPAVGSDSIDNRFFISVGWNF